MNGERGITRVRFKDLHSLLNGIFRDLWSHMVQVSPIVSAGPKEAGLEPPWGYGGQFQQLLR